MSKLMNLKGEGGLINLACVCFVGRFGLADYTLSLARALSKFAKSEIITAESFSYPSVSFDGAVTKIFRRSRHYPIDILRFLIYVWRTRPDVLIFQSVLKVPFIDAMVVRAIGLLGIRVYATVHDVLPHHPRPWSRVENSFFYRSFDGLIAHSAEAQQRLINLGILAPIEVIPHGVYDIYRIGRTTRDQARERFGFDSDDFVALFFGLLDPRKGVEFLVDLVETDTLPSGVKLFFAGRNALGQFDSGLEDRFTRVAHSDRCFALVREISFDEVEQVFLAADVVLLPYREGTTSGVLKLAVAFDRPVIASAIGDLPSNVLPGTGIFFDLDEPVRGIADALEAMRARYDAFALACEQSAEEYGWEKIGQRYYEFVSRR